MSHKLLPKAGAWIFVKQVVPTEVPIHKLALYYAIPSGVYYWDGEMTPDWMQLLYDSDFAHYMSEFGGNDNFKRCVANYKRNPHFEFRDKELELLESLDSRNLLGTKYVLQAQIKIITEYGEVHLQPHEYELVDDAKLQEYMESVKSGDAFIMYLSKSKQLKGKIADQVFYLRTRGISFSTAIQMCIGSISTRNLMYIYMHPGYVEFFTRTEEFERYITKHVEYMRKAGLKEEADHYLGLVHQIQGYENFMEPEAPVVKQKRKSKKK